MNIERVIAIQIDDGAPFVPDDVMSAEVLIGTIETTQPGDDVRTHKPTSRVAYAHYTRDGLEHDDYYRTGAWKYTADGTAIFHVRDLLEIDS